MQTVGIDLTTNILVTDRGFQSILNTQNAINLQLKYIQFLSLTEGGVRAQLRRNLPALTHPIACRDPYYQVSAKRVPDVWTENCEGVSIASNSQNGTEFLSSWNGSNWLYLLAPLHGWDWLQHQGVA